MCDFRAIPFKVRRFHVRRRRQVVCKQVAVDPNIEATVGDGCHVRIRCSTLCVTQSELLFVAAVGDSDVRSCTRNHETRVDGITRVPPRDLYDWIFNGEILCIDERGRPRNREIPIDRKILGNVDVSVNIEEFCRCKCSYTHIS